MKFTATVVLLLICGLIRTSMSFWKFPGLLKHDESPKREDELFQSTMKELLQPGDVCNFENNEILLKFFQEWLRKQTSMEAVRNEFLQRGKGAFCRYDLTVCVEAQAKCLCNSNAELDEASKSCRIRVGWPCTEGETVKPDECTAKAACKPWEGSFSYDTEMFPSVSDFFTDAGTFFCRCNDEQDADCGGAAEDAGSAKSGAGLAVSSLSLPIYLKMSRSVVLTLRHNVTFDSIFLLLCILLFIAPQTSSGYWKFPGLLKHDDNPEAEDEIFRETMSALLQPKAPCHQKDNEDLYEDFQVWLKGQSDIHAVKNEMIRKGKGVFCRFDVTVCGSEVDDDNKPSVICVCNAQTRYDNATNSCRLEVGWPCTEGEASKPKQCIEDAACKPWEGSFNYDTEAFPTARDFFTDSGSYFCRCANEEDTECGGAKEDSGKSGTLAIHKTSLARFMLETVIAFVIITRILKW